MARRQRNALLGLALAVAVAADGLAQTTTLVSAALGGGWANGPSTSAALSRDGRHVAFASAASDIVGGDTNGVRDAFVYDRVHGTTRLVSVGLSGAPANGASDQPVLSGDGRYVAFRSEATNLVPGDTNASSDIFLRDMQTATTIRISVASDGTQAWDGSYDPALSSDGMTVAFMSVATTLVPGDTNAREDVFVRDVVAGTTSRVSVATGGGQTILGHSFDPDLSADGRYVAFTSQAPNLMPGDTNGGSDVFLHDRVAGTTVCVSVDGQGRVVSGSSWQPSVDADARYVAFSSRAPDLVPSDTNGSFDVFLHDMTTGATRRISLGVGGVEAVGGSMLDAFSGYPDISDDGAYVAFYSYAINLLPTDPFGGPEVYLTNVRSGLTHRIAVDPTGAPSMGVSFLPAISGDGRVVAFESTASDLLPGDVNDSSDVFVRDLDVDDDGLLEGWETTFGLDPRSSNGDDGAAGDPDGDGRPNATEQTEGTHPRGFHRRYLAEGASSAFFDTRLALLNPGVDDAAVIDFRRAGGAGTTVTLPVGGLTRTTLGVTQVQGLELAEFSMSVESAGPVVVDRLMRWDASGYGSHAETAIDAPSTTWYLAEGATHHHFQLFYLLQNPNAISVPVTVTYLRPAPAPPLTKVYTVPAQSRFNIWVNAEAASDPALAGLAATDVSARLVATEPILVERAMYLSQAGADGVVGNADDILYGAGHASAGIAAPAIQWFLAEGATGPYFDEFILIANPGTTDAVVDVRYLLPDGTVLAKDYEVPAASRFNIWVNEEEFTGLGKALANVSLSATLTSTNGVPVIVERAMWWPRPSPYWMEAHNSAGVTATGTVWGLAEGEAGGPSRPRRTSSSPTRRRTPVARGSRSCSRPAASRRSRCHWRRTAAPTSR